MKLVDLIEAKKRSSRMEAAIAAIVRDEDENVLTDDEVRAVGQKHGLSDRELEELVVIAQGPIGY